ncbi:MAG: O-methyltransferase [Nitrospirota bacterium]
MTYGGKLRKSRFHDEKGNLISIRNLFYHGPMALMSSILRFVFNYRPALPWISYSAIGKLKDFLNEESVILEFGSGMSTIWFARHAKRVYSVEDNVEWYKKVTGLIVGCGIDNVHYRFAEGKDYYSFMSDQTERFDLIMVDGSNRSDCIRNVMHLLKPGAMIYLDNSDKHSSPSGGDTRIAEDMLLNLSKDCNGDMQYFTDFAPAQFFVQEGLMIRLK